MPNLLKDLIENTQRAQGSTASYNPDGSVRHVHKQPAANVHRLSLRELILAPFMGLDKLSKIHCPVGTAAGKRTTFSDVLMTQSRVAAAGAHIVLIEEPAEALPVGKTGVIALQKHTSGLTVVEPVNFAQVADGADVTASPAAGFIYRDEIDLDAIPAYGFRVELSRAEMKAFAEGKLADETLAAIAMGVAKLADKVLLSAVAALNPAAFTFNAAAAAGLKWAELKAFIGTSGTNAFLSDAGDLRLAIQSDSLIKTGVPAELTDTIALSVLGAFNRAGVAVAQDITLTSERMNVNGEQVLTCWVNAQALLPRPGVFWKP